VETALFKGKGKRMASRTFKKKIKAQNLSSANPIPKPLKP